MSEKDVLHHLKILKDESDNEDEKEEDEKEQNGGDNISFFD